MTHLKSKIRHVPDFPKPGILFYDITTLLGDARGFRDTVDALAAPYMGEDIDTVVGIESRGFILGAAVANALGCGFVPIRKPGKLPSRTIRESYSLETAPTARDARRRGPAGRACSSSTMCWPRAYGGSGDELVKQLGGDLRALAFLIELNFLNGRTRLPGEAVYSVLQY